MTNATGSASSGASGGATRRSWVTAFSTSRQSSTGSSRWTTTASAWARRFYEKLGFRVAAVREGAIDEARKLKPSIPLVGQGGVPITDEIELERSP